jgi:hypothetical protein
MGGAPTAGDFAIAPMLFYGALPGMFSGSHPIVGFIKKHLRIEGAPRTLEWIGCVMAWDREE